MESRRAIEKLEALEARIATTARRFAELKSRYESLREQKSALEQELAVLQAANRELSDSIHHLKSIQDESRTSLNREELRQRIDRVLEKLGEIEL